MCLYMPAARVPTQRRTLPMIGQLLNVRIKVSFLHMYGKDATTSSPQAAGGMKTLSLSKDLCRKHGDAWFTTNEFKLGVLQAALETLGRHSLHCLLLAPKLALNHEFRI